jgi:hypothetical protein
MVAMRVGVDDHHHWLRSDGLHLIENPLAHAGVLGVDDDNAFLGNESGCVAASTGDHVEIVFDLLHFEGHGLLLLSGHQRDSAGKQKA